MRLSMKLGGAIALGIVAILAAYGLARVQRESRLFENDIRRDHMILGHAVALLASAAAERDGIEHALRLVDEADLGQAHVALSFKPDPNALLGGAPTSATLVQDGQRFIRTRVPARIGVVGHLELLESLSDEDAYLDSTRRRTLVVTLLLIGLSTTIIFGFGFLLLGRPLRQLVLKARRIGEGDLGSPLELAQRDEIGELAREINAMCERLGDANERVAAEAEARMRTLEQLRHAERLITVGKLAAGVAHELGTPLNVVSARAKMIAIGESQGAQVTSDARIIHEQVARMTRIIRQLLDFARRTPPNKSDGDLSRVIATTFEMLSALARNRGVTLENPKPDPCHALIDAGQMQQVVTNLVVNAIHAQPEGGSVRVWAEACGAGEPNGAAACVVVEDEGEGMNDETRDRAFEPFYTTKDVGQGTGLGLSVVHGIVKEHGGDVLIDSRPHQGTRVRVFLP